MPSHDELLTAHEAAQMLRLNVRRVQTLARAGALPAVRAGRKWLFSRSALEQSLQPPLRLGSPREGQTTFAAIDLSARNQLRGVIARLTVDGLMAEVEIAIGDQRLVSVITRQSAERLALCEGAAVFAVIKSTEIMIARAAAS